MVIIHENTYFHQVHGSGRQFARYRALVCGHIHVWFPQKCMYLSFVPIFFSFILCFLFLALFLYLYYVKGAGYKTSAGEGYLPVTQQNILSPHC